MTEDTATLEPPGSIAVIGAGPLGIEAALYGRFLGYNVTLFEAVEVAHSMADGRDQPIPMMPDRCLSPLAKGALEAQAGDDEPKSLPLSIGEWIDRVWLPLTQTDLLRDRLRCPARVSAMELVSPQTDGGEDSDEENDVPPDFRLRLAEGETADFEAVILATAAGGREIQRSFDEPVDYLFAVGRQPSGDAEQDFASGLKQIVAVYASLGGRADLDLYRPPRG
ncbi:hypothetical protein [Stieleria mannarensis]|uniref:hypothetical protein n=1 Tax=Stieleria mannarensis TaxID=2755585 RepID=UPI0016012D40|nr:hypothetical protein [Rhodopirellula sp. JC639]